MLGAAAAVKASPEAPGLKTAKAREVGDGAPIALHHTVGERYRALVHI
jgi:hypothetical protein